MPRHQFEEYLEEVEPWPSTLISLEDIRALDRDIYQALMEQLINDSEEDYGAIQ